MENAYEEMILAAGNGSVRKDEPLKSHTTFRVGGPASVFVSVKDEDTLKAVLTAVKKNDLSWMLIGNGSNLLVSDLGYEGVVISLAGSFSDISVSGTKITAGAGALLSKVCSTALKEELTGLEFAYGIPGSVGGAMVMNAGAYDGEMKDVVESVKLMDADGNIFILSNAEMEFAYRNSILKSKNYIALETVFELKKGNPDEIGAKMRDLMERRRTKQPLEFPSAGSTFKRPEGNFAGKLIMEAGLAGFRNGGACVSPKHCGFIVNDGDASASDIYGLINTVAGKVYETSGVRLEPEVIFVGKF